MFNMFGAKPFSTPFAASTSTFGASTPFGGNTSTFTAKTTGTSAGFSTPGFGSNTPAPTGGLFGQNTSSSTATGLFRGGQQTTFGGSQNTGFTFGSTPSASGGLFGQNNQSTGGGLFATPVSNTAFGAKTPGFSGFSATGNAASTGSTLFVAQSSGSSLFGQTSGFASTATSGTTVKFNPPNGQDTIVKNGVTTNITTKHQCITAIKEYENKSIEEVRLEDYVANRKGKQRQAVGSLFGTTPATQTTGFNFGVAGSGTGFGGSGNTSTFTAKTTCTSVGFNTPGFGSNTPTHTRGLFGQNTSSSTATRQFGGGQQTATFGGSQNTGFAFVSTPSASGGLLGKNNQSTGAGLFATPASNTAFGAKTPGFSVGTSTGTSLFGQQQSTSLFGQQNKTAFGTTTAASTGLGFGTNTGTGTSLFGQQQKSTDLFAQKLPAFGTSTTGSPVFNFNTGSQGSSNLFARTLSNSTFSSFSKTPISTGGIGFIQSGTLIKFSPPNGQDTIMEDGVTTNINTKHQCITAMTLYENKSIEELRLEDYAANRKGKQQRVDILFGKLPATQAAGFNFGGAGSGTGFGTSGGFSISTRTFGTTTTFSGFASGTSTDTRTSFFGQQEKLGYNSIQLVSKRRRNWHCTICHTKNKTEAKMCAACGSAKSSESTAAEINQKCMDAGSQTDLGESTVAEIKPECMDAGSQTDLRESAVAEIKPECIDVGSQTDFGDFASTLVTGGLATATSGLSTISTSIALSTATLISSLPIMATPNELLPSVRSSSPTEVRSGELLTDTIPVVSPTVATPILTWKPPGDIISENNTSNSEAETITVALNALEISSSTH